MQRVPQLTSECRRAAVQHAIDVADFQREPNQLVSVK
jgi:hypothetical protein